MENLRLGICDDETQDLAQILEMVKRYDEDCQLQITTFLHAKDLLHAAKTSGFDITILDIEMVRVFLQNFSKKQVIPTVFRHSGSLFSCIASQITPLFGRLFFIQPPFFYALF